MQRICRPTASARRCSPTARAVCPPMPASISSNTSRGPALSLPLSEACATLRSASITRESSPPEAISRSGPAGRPGLAAIISSTVSAPRGPHPPSRGANSTENVASGMASSASRSRTAALGLREDLGDPTAVLSLQSREQRQTLLDLLQPPGRALQPLRVRAERRPDVLGLVGERDRALGQGGELRVDGRRLLHLRGRACQKLDRALA